MVEYIERYEAFASYLTDRGFVVVGHDHLGHGKSVADEEDLWIFPKRERQRICSGRYPYPSQKNGEEISGDSIFYAGT